MHKTHIHTHMHATHIKTHMHTTHTHTHTTHTHTNTHTHTHTHIHTRTHSHTFFNPVSKALWANQCLIRDKTTEQAQRIILVSCLTLSCFVRIKLHTYRVRHNYRLPYRLRIRSSKSHKYFWTECFGKNEEKKRKKCVQPKVTPHTVTDNDF